MKQKNISGIKSKNSLHTFAVKFHTKTCNKKVTVKRLFTGSRNRHVENLTGQEFRSNDLCQAKTVTATMITVPRKTAAKMHPRTALIMVPTRARTACRTRARTVPGIALKTSIRTRQRMITAIVTD